MSILTGDGLRGRVRVFSTMGTVVSLTLPGPVREAGWADGPEQIFTAADRRFSLYRSDSEVSLIAAGMATLPGSSAELRRMYALALDWRTATGGDFTPHRPDGVVDLSGVVKSWAVAASGAWLHSEGYPDWCLNAGGDVLCSGTADDGEPWHVGIVDPQARQSLLGGIVASAARPAVATSGSAERGDHIWRRAGVRAEFVQVTVRAADIITADVLATAVIAGGTRALNHASSAWPVDILAVRPDGSLLATPGFARH